MKIDFVDFLIKAKLAGYATSGEGQKLIFEEEEVYSLHYHGGSMVQTTG